MSYEEQFLADLRQVLNHLYGYVAYLQNHPFGDWFGELETSGVTRSQFIRQLVVDGIESLNPGAQYSPRSPEARAYQILVRRYMESQSPAEVSDELGIVERQFYRDQRRAIGALASILWERKSLAEGATGQAQPDPLLSEAARVTDEGGREPVDVCELLRDTVRLAGELSRSSDVLLDAQYPPMPLMIGANRTLLRQAILQIVVGLCALPGDARVSLSVGLEHGHVLVRIEAAGLPAGAFTEHMSEHLQIAERVLSPIQGEVQSDESASNQVVIRFPARIADVLIVEDNADAITLFARYLADRPCHVTGLTSEEDIVSTAAEMQPAVVVVDLMMPTADGWEVLQKLKTNPHTAGLSVVVCSVLSQESLAASLGADGYIRKPVTREQFLAVLDPLLRRQGSLEQEAAAQPS